MEHYDHPQAAAVADEILLLKDGAVLAHGATKDVMIPAHLATAYGISVEMLVRSDGRRVIVPSGLA
jgi:iron complex transport system ATP-binding protein